MASKAPLLAVLFLGFWGRSDVECNENPSKCDCFVDLRVVHPGRGANLPPPSTLSAFQVQVSLKQAPQGCHALSNSLPVEVPTGLYGDNCQHKLEVALDSQLWGSVSLFEQNVSQSKTSAGGVSVRNEPGAQDHSFPSEQCSRQEESGLANLVAERHASMQRFRDSQFGSDEAIQQFSKWTSLADKMSAVSLESCDRKTEASEVNEQEAAFVQVAQRRAGSVWDEPGMTEPASRLWVSLEIHGVASGAHDVRVRLTKQSSEGRSVVAEDGVEVRVMSAEEEGRLPVASATLHLEPPQTDERLARGQDQDDLRDITVCVLSGFPTGARETLMNSLRTWVDAGLLHAVGETVIFLQELMETDFVAIPREVRAFAPDRPPPRLRILGASANVGIGRAMWELVNAAVTEHVIFLEDDWILPYGEAKWEPLVRAAGSLLRRGLADVVRLKSDELSPQMEGGGAGPGGGYQFVLNCGRFAAPDPPHFFCACLDESMARPEQWGGPVEQVFHDVEVCHRSGPADTDGPLAGAGGLTVYCMPARVCKYTNTPTMFTRAFFRSALGPTAVVDPGIAFSKHFLEETVNLSWPLRPIVVGVPDSGLFGHVELDDKSPGGPLPTFN